MQKKFKNNNNKKKTQKDVHVILLSERVYVSFHMIGLSIHVNRRPIHDHVLSVLDLDSVWMTKLAVDLTKGLALLLFFPASARAGETI